MCVYVDDLNTFTGSREYLLRVVDFLREFEDHFSLSLAQAKTRVWATNLRSHEHLRETTGFAVERSLNALGAEWPTNPAANITHARELARLDECMNRLVRARTLSLPAPKLALIGSTGCFLF